MAKTKFPTLPRHVGGGAHATAGNRNSDDDIGSAVYRESIAVFGDLKRKYRSYYREAPKAFRATVQLAEKRVFKLRPGPRRKSDPRIGKAARRRARGGAWKELYALYIDGYLRMTEHTRSYAEEGFRKKVNDYLRRHPRLKSGDRNPAPN
jgi:hypothetical protein